MTLFAWKLLFPDHVHLTRGNHETKNMNKMYGFEGEVGASPRRTPLLRVPPVPLAGLPRPSCAVSTAGEGEAGRYGNATVLGSVPGKAPARQLSPLLGGAHRPARMLTPTRSLQALPLGAVIAEKVFVVHGGLFQRDGVTLDEIAKIDRCERRQRPPAFGRGEAATSVSVALGS